jgi:8-oxo-dGTP pyrophosphatase MutT (NUDIX family)
MREDRSPVRLEQVLDRLSAAGAPARRTAPGGPGENGRVRGDHDLSPELYDPRARLKAAAVLVPIVDRTAGPTVLLTRRTDHLHDHAGQISFPGGRIDAGDSGPESAALREAQEEIGLPAPSVRLLCRLDTYIVRTGFEVVPVVGLVSPPLRLALDRFEVAEAFEVPLAFFLTPGTKQRHSRMFRGKERYFYAYPYRDYYIWGATAGMLGNLAEILVPDLMSSTEE